MRADAIAGLTNLGFSRRRAMQRADAIGTAASVEELLRKALQRCQPSTEQRTTGSSQEPKHCAAPAGQGEPELAALAPRRPSSGGERRLPERPQPSGQGTAMCTTMPPVPRLVSGVVFYRRPDPNQPKFPLLGLEPPLAPLDMRHLSVTREPAPVLQKKRFNPSKHYDWGAELKNILLGLTVMLPFFLGFFWFLSLIVRKQFRSLTH
jgi:hypothetical protein